jgi:RNA polymerase sigma factor (TIGR02999 family)
MTPPRPPRPDPGEVTSLLGDWSRGESSALGRLMPLLYDELRRLASSLLRGERGGHTLQPTALVHEAFLRLLGERRVDAPTRARFFAVAATAMRRVLVDHARSRLRLKRGGGETAVALPEELAGEIPLAPIDVLALDVALDRLAVLDAQQARIVELRYFAGLSIEETAELVGASPATVKRDWTSARAFLLRELSATP